jgi:hypothetical protein
MRVVGPNLLHDIVKVFFSCSALLSIVLGFYSVWTSVAGSAHNHYASRYSLLAESGVAGLGGLCHRSP